MNEHPILELKGVCKSFGGVVTAKDVNFSVRPGEVHGLIGPNGAGKTTIMNLISGIFETDRGSIFYAGGDISRTPSHLRARMGIGRTFQTPRPFGNLSVRDNIYSILLQRYGFREAQGKADEILELSKLMHLADAPASKLSIEKRKWMDLARVLATEPKLIMMDEVMAGLNPNEMLESFEFIREINRRGITVLFIEHVMRAVVSVCMRVIVLNEGKFLYGGAPNDALNDPTVVAAYIGGGKLDA